MGLPTVILSCNEDPTYYEFRNIIPQMYERMGFNVRLAILSRQRAEGWYGDTYYFHPVGHLPEFAQAKMIRFILASMMGDTVCYIDDIDLFPLRKDFITSKTDNRPAGHLLCVGGEVYDNNGCYPISQMTAEGHVWKKFINPHDKNHHELFKDWSGPTMFDRREDMGIKLDWSKDDYFSDERLLRRLLHENPVPKFELPRGYDNYLDATIDRHTHNRHTDVWEFDREKLKAGGYVNAHGARPYNKYKHHYEPLIQYVNDNY